LCGAMNTLMLSGRAVPTRCDHHLKTRGHGSPSARLCPPYGTLDGTTDFLCGLLSSACAP
jgi:hypothetical protein